MRIAISNLAWEVVDDERVAAHLLSRQIDAIDIAPGKYFSDFRAAGADEIGRVREWWAERGIAITGMQALLFGTAGLNLFGPPEVQAAMLAHLGEVCRIGAGLGAAKLVFGSPKNRDRATLSNEQAQSLAVSFFRRLGEIAARHGVWICLEPNPPCYGANFMTNSAETAQVVRDVSHPAIRMQLDTGAITLNGEDPGRVVHEYRELIGHVHASEPNLVVLGDGATRHAEIAAALKAGLLDQIVSIEMLQAKNEPHLTAIARALDVAIRHYRTEPPACVSGPQLRML